MPSVNIIEDRIAVVGKREGVAGTAEVLLQRGKSSSRKRSLATLLGRAQALREGRFIPCANKSASFSFVAACMIFAVLFFLLPGVSTAARIAGDGQPVTTAPAAEAIAPQKTAVPKKAAATTEKSTTAAAPADKGVKQAAAPASGVAASAAPVKTVPADKGVAQAAASASGSAASAAAPVKAVPAEKGVKQAAAAASGAAASAAPRTPATAIPAPARPVQQPANAGGAPVVHPVFPPQTQPPAASPGGATAGSGRYVTIDFDNVDISVFIKFVSELTGRNFVVDDKVKGKVTVISPRKIAVDEVYKVFESVLEIYGFATVQAGEVIKVIPALEARGKNLELRLKKDAVLPEDRIVTQILSLQHADANEMKKVLDPIVSKTSIVLSYPPTGMLIITDVLSNIKRLQEIVAALDVEGVGQVISYLPLKYASALDMSKSLMMIFQQQAGKGALSPIRIVADERTNALIMLASENDTHKVKDLLALMDKDIPRGAGAIRVYYLQNAKAEDLVKVLTGLPQQTKAAPGAPAAPAAAAAPISKNVQIVADKATNALIITADNADYLILEDVIRKLDITRPMVYLEALIMEVNADKGFRLGVEWQGANAGSYRDRTGTIVGGFSDVSGSDSKPYGIAQNLVSGKGLPSGLSLGVVGQMINVATGVATISFPNLAAFIQAYQSDSDFRFLSTPQLLTLDNEEAEITVGSTIPYVTRQDTAPTSTTNNYNYSNYAYNDVGVTLKVTPQINKDGFIRMKLDQSVTKVDSKTADVGSGVNILAPTTLKRTAKTTVTIKDGETVVLGGMIEENSESGTYKVPLLGDIPLLGWLFKSRSKSFKRTNLFVFITPRIIRTPEDAAAIHEDKKEYMKTITEGTIKNTPAKKAEKSSSPGIREVTTSPGPSGNAPVTAGSGDAAGVK